jgi:hypothetical protein
MSGSKSCLKTGDRIVVDTHVYKWAAIHELKESRGHKAWAAMQFILDLCPIVHIDPRQKNEIVTMFGRYVGCRLEQTAFFPRLDHAGKARKVVLSKSTSKPLDARTKKFLQAIESSSDHHLFETARALDRVLITDDGRLLDNRVKLEQFTGVTVLGYDDILPDSGEVEQAE